MISQKGYEHLLKTEQQLRTWFNGKLNKGKIGNLNFTDFYNWYKAESKVCHYCDLTEEQSQQIVRNGKLKSRRFPQGEIHGRGTSRGCG